MLLKENQRLYLKRCLELNRVHRSTNSFWPNLVREILENNLYPNKSKPMLNNNVRYYWNSLPNTSTVRYIKKYFGRKFVHNEYTKQLYEFGSINIGMIAVYILPDEYEEERTNASYPINEVLQYIEKDKIWKVI